MPREAKKWFEEATWLSARWFWICRNVLVISQLSRSRARKDTQRPLYSRLSYFWIKHYRSYAKITLKRDTQKIWRMKCQGIFSVELALLWWFLPKLFGIYWWLAEISWLLYISGAMSAPSVSKDLLVSKVFIYQEHHLTARAHKSGAISGLITLLFMVIGYLQNKPWPLVMRYLTLMYNKNLA